jgi:integrase/recombinase XerC
MFELFYSSGLRLSELTGLAPPDVDYDEGIVRVTGKGSKTRIVPVGKQAVAALSAWLGTRAQIARCDADALFVNRLGRRLTPRSVQLRLKAWALKQGLSTRVHPHALRHSFASHVLQSSGDLRAVQEMLGHASISTTQIYTHLDFQHLAKVYDAAHPRARTKTAARAARGMVPDKSGK